MKWTAGHSIRQKALRAGTGAGLPVLALVLSVFWRVSLVQQAPDENRARSDNHAAESTAVRIPEPYAFYSKGTITAVPGPQYEAGPLWRFFLGDGYRDVWAAPAEFPIIDFERTADGLTPLRLGGGNQTTSLHLRGGDGHEYRLRLIEKDEARSLPAFWQGTFVEGIAEDLGSALNPYAPLAVAPLARAAGIFHTMPTLVYVPDGPRLGSFREVFAGTLALFERKPDDDQSEARQFGHAANVIETDDLLEKLRMDSTHRVDQRSYARARLFDMLIGDWDRHEGQWHWGEFVEPEGTRYLPVPVDRDFAFARFDGFLNQIGRALGLMRIRRLTNFNKDISDLKGLNWQARGIDVRFTDRLSRDDWVAAAEHLRRALSNEAIERAVRTWPEPVFRLIGPETIAALRSRRDQLPGVAARYYEMLHDPNGNDGLPIH